MENFTLQNQSEAFNVTNFKTNSLLPPSLTIALNYIMATKNVLQAKSNNLLLQKNVALDKLPDIKEQQEAMRENARHYLVDRLSNIFALLTDITGFYDKSRAFYQDVADYIDVLSNSDSDEDAKNKVLKNLDVIFSRRLINDIKARKDNTNELMKSLINDRMENDKLSERLKKTKATADKLFVGDESEIAKLQAEIKSILEVIDQCNKQTARGATDAANTILKISTTLIAYFNPAEKPEPKPEVKPTAKLGLKLDVEAANSKLASSESTPIVENNLQLFSSTTNKLISSPNAQNLQENIDNYRKCVEKLTTYNIEAAVFSVLMQQWIAFVNNMEAIEKYVAFLAEAWQELEENYTTLKDTFSSSGADLEAIKQQWKSSNTDWKILYKKAQAFQLIKAIEVIKDHDEEEYITSYTFRNVLRVPNVTPIVMQMEIIENSKP